MTLTDKQIETRTMTEPFFVTGTWNDAQMEKTYERVRNNELPCNAVCEALLQKITFANPLSRSSSLTFEFAITQLEEDSPPLSLFKVINVLFEQGYGYTNKQCEEKILPGLVRHMRIDDDNTAKELKGIIADILNKLDCKRFILQVAQQQSQQPWALPTALALLGHKDRDVQPYAADVILANNSWFESHCQTLVLHSNLDIRLRVMPTIKNKLLKDNYLFQKHPKLLHFLFHELQHGHRLVKNEAIVTLRTAISDAWNDEQLSNVLDDIVRLNLSTDHQYELYNTLINKKSVRPVIADRALLALTPNEYIAKKTGLDRLVQLFPFVDASKMQPQIEIVTEAAAGCFYSSWPSSTYISVLVDGVSLHVGKYQNIVPDFVDFALKYRDYSSVTLMDIIRTGYSAHKSTLLKPHLEKVVDLMVKGQYCVDVICMALIELVVIFPLEMQQHLPIYTNYLFDPDNKLRITTLAVACVLSDQYSDKEFETVRNKYLLYFARVGVRTSNPYFSTSKHATYALCNLAKKNANLLMVSGKNVLECFMDECFTKSQVDNEVTTSDLRAWGDALRLTKIMRGFSNNGLISMCLFEGKAMLQLLHRCDRFFDISIN